MKMVLTFLVLIGLCQPAIAVEGDRMKPGSALAPSRSSALVAKNDAEMRVLRAEAATMKEYHSSLLDTVYWALGTVVTVAALLVGFGWFSNFKFHESEKQRLKDELEAKLKEALSSFDARLSENEVTLLNSVDSRLMGYMDRVSRDVDNAKAEVLRMQNDSIAAIQQIRNELVTLRFDVNASQKRDSAIEVSLRMVEEHIWEMKDVPVNTLITQAQALESAIDSEQGHYISAALSRMQKTIKTHILPQKETVSKAILDIIRERLDRAVKFDAVAAAAVSELVEKIEVDK